MQVLAPHIPDFVVLTPGRSGSTFLATLLDSHPGVRSAGELVGSQAISPGEPEKALEFVFDRVRNARAQSSKPLFGFKLPIYCVERDPGLARELFRLGTRCVVLYRKDKLAMYVSMRLAQINNEWSSTRRYEIQELEIDIKDMLATMRAFRRLDALMFELTAGWSRTVASYEACLGDPDVPYIQDFLGVPVVPLSTPTLRARTVPLRTAVRNFDEVVAVLKSTEFAPLLVLDAGVSA